MTKGRLPKLTAAMLHPQAEGRWLEIFRYCCPGVFDEAIDNIGQHVTCPFHGGENDFRFLKKSRKGGNTPQTGVAMCTCGPMKGAYPDGFAVLHRAMGGRFIDVLKEVDEYLNGPRNQESPRPAKVVVPQVKVTSLEDAAAENARIMAKVTGLWNSGKTFDREITPYYLERGIDPRILEGLQDVRMLASLPYWTTVKKQLTKLGSYPALLGAMRDHQGNLVAVHRTWLSEDRKAKAPVPKAKKLSETPDATGAAIRLFEAEGSDILGLTEGVETGLGVRQLTAGHYFPDLGPIPVWATYSAGNISNFEVPEILLPTLRKIIVFADNDENGTSYAAALTFKERMAIEHPDIEVEIRMPDLVGWDWLDVLVNL